MEAGSSFSHVSSSAAAVHYLGLWSWRDVLSLWKGLGRSFRVLVGVVAVFDEACPKGVEIQCRLVPEW